MECGEIGWGVVEPEQPPRGFVEGRQLPIDRSSNCRKLKAWTIENALRGKSRSVSIPIFFGVISGAAVTITLLLRFVVKLPDTLFIALCAITGTLLFVWLLVYVFSSNNRSLESIGIANWTQSDLKRRAENPIAIVGQSLNRKSEAEPNLESEALLDYVGRENGIFQNYVNIEYEAAIVEFRNRAVKGGKVPSFDRVKAHITYYDKDDNKAGYINAGSWLGEEDNSVRLRVGDFRQLIIALYPHKSSHVLAVQNNCPDIRPETNVLTKLVNEQYKVDIDLVDLDRGEVIGNFKFSLLRNTSSPILTIKPLPFEKE